MRSKALRLGAAAVAAAILVTVGVGWTQDSGPRKVTHRWVQHFGMLSPGFGQTLRLHIARLDQLPPPDADTPPPDSQFPPDPCRVALAFFNSQGQMIGAPVVRSLDPGKSTFVDVSFERPAAEVAFPPDPCRATAWVLLDTRRGETPPDPCRATLELLETGNGRVSLNLSPAAQHQLPAVQH